MLAAMTAAFAAAGPTFSTNAGGGPKRRGRGKFRRGGSDKPMCRDVWRGWTGVRRVRFVTIGETKSERRQRDLRAFFRKLAAR